MKMYSTPILELVNLRTEERVAQIEINQCNGACVTDSADGRFFALTYPS